MRKASLKSDSLRWEEKLRCCLRPKVASLMHIMGYRRHYLGNKFESRPCARNSVRIGTSHISRTERRQVLLFVCKFVNSGPQRR